MFDFAWRWDGRCLKRDPVRNNLPFCAIGCWAVDWLCCDQDAMLSPPHLTSASYLLLSHFCFCAQEKPPTSSSDAEFHIACLMPRTTRVLLALVHCSKWHAPPPPPPPSLFSYPPFTLIAKSGGGVDRLCSLLRIFVLLVWHPTLIVPQHCSRSF